MMNYTKNATVCSMSELTNLNAGVTHLTIGSNCMNENSTVLLHFTRFTQLKALVIGDNCFSLNDDDDSSGRFYVKNCPALEKLQIGKYSFSDYTTCKIERVDSLEIIEIGELSDWSENFDRASLELKSVVAPSES